MKKLFFLVFVFYSITSSAQVWCTPGSKWHHPISYFSTAGYSILTYEKDTLFLGRNCQKIIQYSHTVDQWNWTYNDFYDTLFTCDSSGIIFHFNKWSQVWDTMYNFNANPGEGWEMIGTNFYTNVLDTGRIIVQGENLKWQYVEYTPPLFSNNYDTIYERIGARKNFAYSSTAVLTDPDIGGVCSFTDSTINQFPYSDIACEYMPDGLSELNKNKMIIVYPNPSDGKLFMKFEKEIPLAFDILDISGRICNNGTFVKYSNLYLLDEFDPGIYFLRFHFKDKNVVERIEIIK